MIVFRLFLPNKRMLDAIGSRTEARCPGEARARGCLRRFATARRTRNRKCMSSFDRLFLRTCPCTANGGRAACASRVLGTLTVLRAYPKGLPRTILLGDARRASLSRVPAFVGSFESPCVDENRRIRKVGRIPVGHRAASVRGGPVALALRGKTSSAALVSRPRSSEFGAFRPSFPSSRRMRSAQQVDDCETGRSRAECFQRKNKNKCFT